LFFAVGESLLILEPSRDVNMIKLIEKREEELS